MNTISKPVSVVAWLVCTLGVLTLSRPLYAAQAARPPNILFALADDWSYGHAGAYGCTWVKTPSIDRVARQGIVFTNAFTPEGKCGPSRSSIITGRNPWQLKAAANHWSYFPPEFKSVVEALGEQAYFTGMTGKGWAPGVALDEAGRSRNLTGKRFQKHEAAPPTAQISSNDYTANFADFLDAAPPDKPWFFWYGGDEPHRAYEYGTGVAVGGKQTADIDQVPGCWPDNDTVRNDMLDYAFEVEHFDRHLGRMLAELEKRGLLENTLVIVTSDNGMPFPHVKGYAYYNSNHLPLIVMWGQGIPHAGRVVNDYVSFIDFAPTFLEAAALAWDQTGMAPLTGRSLLEIFKSEKSGRVIAARDHVLIGKERTDVGRPNDVGYPIRGIVKAEMLYLHNFETSRWPGGDPVSGYPDTDGSPTKTEVLKTRLRPEQRHYWERSFGKLPSDQLFDLRTDPHCLNNLAASGGFAALREQLTAALKAQADPRMAGHGHIFDAYPSANPGERGFYEKIMRGEPVEHGWLNDSDFERPPVSP